MNEWGVPDWRDASAYPQRYDEWSVKRWRWEFYRRRADLREYFDRWAPETYEHETGYYDFCVENDCRHDERIPLKPHEAGFTAKRLQFPTGHKLSEEDHYPFGYLLGIPNPRIGEQPESILHWFNAGTIAEHEYSERTEKAAKTVREAIRSTDNLSFEQYVVIANHLEGHPVRIGEHQHAIVFDLTQPIPPQLANAKENLDAMQEKKFGKTVQRRNSQNHWPNYLRVLDARDDGASWRTIASFLPSTVGDSITFARNRYQQADRLRFNFHF